MADNIQFQVDAVLGDVSDIETKLKKLNTNLKLTIQNQNALISIQKVQDKIDVLKKSIEGTNINIGTSGIGQSFDDINSKAQQTKTNLNTMFNGVNSGNVIKQFDQFKIVNDELVSTTNKLKQGITETTTTLKSNGDVIQTVKNNYSQLENSLNRLGTDTGIKIDANSIQNIESLEKVLFQSNAQWDKNKTSIKQFQRKVDDAGNTVTKFTTRQETLKNGRKYWTDTAYAVSSVDNKLREANKTQQEVINSQQNLSTMLASAIKRFAVWGVAMKIWTGIGNAINDCTSYIKDLDEAMTNIRVVTMDTKDATEDLLKTYNQLGQELGANTLDIAEGSIDWLRQGYDVADTETLVKDSTILSKLALIDNAEATEYLTSALKGYKLEAEDAIGVVDQLVSIDLEAATSAGDMAEAIK